MTAQGKSARNKEKGGRGLRDSNRGKKNVRERNEEGVEKVEERVEEVEEEVILEGNEEGVGHRIRRSGIEPWLKTLCYVLGQTLYSYSASLHPGAQMGTGELNARGNPVMD